MEEMTDERGSDEEMQVWTTGCTERTNLPALRKSLYTPLGIENGMVPDGAIRFLPHLSSPIPLEHPVLVAKLIRMLRVLPLIDRKHQRLHP
jgi:hypothetical protein